MKIEATSPDDYLTKVPENRAFAMARLRDVIVSNLPLGFSEEMSYGMIGYVVPHKLYPDGYHCKPELPLPFINIASQKNFVALYHMGMYAKPELLKWFEEEWSSRDPRSDHHGSRQVSHARPGAEQRIAPCPSQRPERAGSSSRLERKRAPPGPARDRLD